jgi:GTP cyclohydrolase II
VAGHLAPADALEAGAAELCRLAGLPPLAVCLPPSAGTPGLAVPLEAVRRCRGLEGLGLQPVSEAGVLLADAEDARLVAFRPADGGPDRLAVVVGEPGGEGAPLCRLHSRPFAGDLLGSLRRGRGDPLRGAIRRMAGEGAGVLLYLAREGRGISGVGLGPGPDEDRFRAAAAMLRHLGIGRVRLLTDDPDEPRRLAECGIEVAGRVPTRPGPGDAR